MGHESGNDQDGGALVEGPAGRIDAFLTEHAVDHEIIVPTLVLTKEVMDAGDEPLLEFVK